MTTFSTRAFGSLGLCSVAALSGTLGVGELPTRLSPAPVSGTTSLQVQSLAHPRALGSGTQLPSFCLPLHSRRQSLPNSAYCNREA